MDNTPAHSKSRCLTPVTPSCCRSIIGALNPDLGIIGSIGTVLLSSMSSVEQVTLTLLLPLLSLPSAHFMERISFLTSHGRIPAGRVLFLNMISSFEPGIFQFSHFRDSQGIWQTILMSPVWFPTLYISIRAMAVLHRSNATHLVVSSPTLALDLVIHWPPF